MCIYFGIPHFTCVLHHMYYKYERCSATNTMRKLLSTLFLLLISFSATKTKKQPNLLIVFTDEHRRQAMEFWLQPEYQGVINGTSDSVITPNLDKLASEGVVFTQVMSTHPVCSPHRAMLLSGRFPKQNGIWMNCYPEVKSQLKNDLECYTDVLYEKGIIRLILANATGLHQQKYLTKMPITLELPILQVGIYPTSLTSIFRRDQTGTASNIGIKCLKTTIFHNMFIPMIPLSSVVKAMVRCFNHTNFRQSMRPER